MEEYKFNCEKCNYHTNTNSYYSIHKKSKKHKKNYEVELKIEENKRTSKKYHCEYCDYYTDCRSGYSIHKRTKKHKKNIEENKKIYNCEECHGKYATNNQSDFLKHYKENHIKQSDYKTINNIMNQNIDNSVNNNTVNNILNIHLENDKESFKLMLNNMNNKKFIELLGGVTDIDEFQKKEMWDSEKMTDKFIENIIEQTIENKTENQSIKDLKMSKSDNKNNMIQIKKDEEKYNKFDSTFVLGNILENNLKLTKDEHMERIINNSDYRKYLIFMDQFAKGIDFKKGYEYNFNDIIKNIIDYTELSINKLKNGSKIENYDLKEKIYNYNCLLNCFKEMKKKLEILLNNN